MGSESRLTQNQANFNVLKSLQINYEVCVHLTHQAPNQPHAYIKHADLAKRLAADLRANADEVLPKNTALQQRLS